MKNFIYKGIFLLIQFILSRGRTMLFRFSVLINVENTKNVSILML